MICVSLPLWYVLGVYWGRSYPAMEKTVLNMDLMVR